MKDKNNYTQKKEHKRKGLVYSMATHILVLLLLFFPLLTKPMIEEIGGISVIFGEEDAGSDDALADNPNTETANTTTPSDAPSNPTNIKSDITDDVSIIKTTTTKKTDTKPKGDNKNVNTEEADRKAREVAEKAKAEKEAADLANQKKKYSDLFGKGKGNNDNSDNQGSPNGTPDGKVLDGISKGSGRVGGGLSGRGLEYEPTFTDNSQKTGKVTLSICVNPDGKVVKADFTQKGSTTSDSYLVNLAKNTALKYKFSKSTIDSQCGTVTIDFKVQ